MLNPITYTEHVVADFLRYQMTTYALADRALRAQLRTLLNLDQTRDTPLLKGPYFSLSKTFRRGTSLQDLGREGILHPHVANIAGHAHAYGHQESAFRAIAAGKTTVVSTGTGSGKTEAFLYPVISQCLRLRDHNAAAGICAVIVYPMNALAEDQLGRLRDLLAGTGVTFGMYVGKTPRERREVSGERLRQGASRAEYRQKVAALQARNDARAVHPPEERASREEMRTPGQQPRILLTNVKQLELLLTRQQDAELFDGALLDFLIFDEAHTFSGAIGAETACLIRRLRSYCGKGERDTVSVATSATIADRTGGNAGRDFAVRFFGVPPDQVELVREDYEPDHWQARRVANGLLAGDPIEHRQAVFQALERADHDGASDEERTRLVQALEAATGIRCRPDAWQLDLHAAMSASETAWQLSDTLDKPRPLGELLVELQRRLGRPIGEEEVLIWLALGAAARREQRPLLRPVVHAFVRGIDGAVVTFPAGRAPRLWLSAAQAEADRDPHFRLPILSCTTCGQHYFEHHVAGFDFTGNQPGGGEARGGHTVWPPLPPGENASRLLLLDRLAIDELDDDDDGTATSAPRRTAPIGFCKHCGALQNQTAQACLGCGRPGSVVGLLAVRQNSNRPGKLSSCIGCGALGGERMGRWRDPARPLRATAVADVHVLAQNMLHYAERRRLLVFADNRQDAAFQAGWMRDHARHYRLRSIIHEQLMVRTHTVGDLVAALDDLLDRDDELSRTLAPEVWSVHRKEELGRAHQGERRKFLRVQVLREITTGARQTIGLEPWGRMRVDYAGLEGAGNFHATWAPRLGCTSADLSLWVACLLDTERRKRIVWDAELKLFSRTWSEADALVSSGFTAGLDLHVRGLKVQRDPGDRKDWVAQWQSSRGMTLARQLLAKLAGSAQVDEGAFFRDLWQYLLEAGLLRHVTLTGQRGNALPNTSGTAQVDADRFLLSAQSGLWRCLDCRRSYARPMPRNLCIRWRCNGQVVRAEEDGDDYDLRVLDVPFAMLRSREHSAQIPQDERERIERKFKSGHDEINTLVATPTLELGVDIGALDGVLMRNVPPAPANYWQRAGRAGRRHRMAVNLTYARPASHDRAYFDDPQKLLLGRIDPPSFNLKNDLMVRKHARAVVLSELRRLRVDSTLSQELRTRVQAALDQCFPPLVKTWLFDGQGNVRTEVYDVNGLAEVIMTHRETLTASVQRVFASQWPHADSGAVAPELLALAVDRMAADLGVVVRALRRRLQWALDQQARLSTAKQQKGALDPDEEALERRCSRLIRRLKGTENRGRSDSEGVDDTETFGVLALEGYLPGYGLDVGTIAVTHLPPPRGNLVDLQQWSLRRANGLALREHVPGNLVYANNHRFAPRFFQPQPEGTEVFQVDPVAEAVSHAGVPGGMATLAAGQLVAMPVCDVDLAHASTISDDEDFRFQLGVTVFGYEQGRHAGGVSRAWGPRRVDLRHGVHLRLVNVGPAARVRQGQLGYPLCSVCGTSRSPFASQTEQTNFAAHHRERCQAPTVFVQGNAGQQIEVIRPMGLYADLVADVLRLSDCESRVEAYSVLEALRLGAAEVLDMEVEDLQVLVIGRPGATSVKGLLYDPMPGGSGLLQQMVERWPEVAAQAMHIVTGCAGQCATSCIDCLQHFRNAFYHRHLDRHVARAALEAWGSALHFGHDIPPRMPEPPDHDGPVNEGERTLQWHLEWAGFPPGEYKHRIDLGGRYGATTPDVFYVDPTGRTMGFCVYKDGLSDRVHGNPERRRIDGQIRDELDAMGYDVLVVSETDLSEREAMHRFFRKLGRRLMDQAELRNLEQRWGVPESST